MEHVVIIGNGIAGITAARHIRKRSDNRITIISSETEFFFARTALMYVYMGHMRFEDIMPYEKDFWSKNRLDLIQDHVQTVNFEDKKLILAQGSPVFYDKLILATGSKYNKFGWKGQDLGGVQGLYSKKDLDLMEQNTRGIKNAVIVGGGLIGVEVAEMLASRNIQSTFLIREKTFWGNALPKEDGDFVTAHLTRHGGIKLLFEEELEEVIGNEEMRVKAVKTKSGDIIDCEFLALTAGVHPNVDFLRESKLEIEKGILVSADLSTNIENVYAIGDCAQIKEPLENRMSIEPVWYTARMMGEAVAQTICGKNTEYKPGHWFNSAKFFDLEYQTYGRVWNELKDDEDEFVWKNTEDERLLHFVFHKKSHVLHGVNSFGIRLRHEIFDHWLSEKKTIEETLENLKTANFDPEFFKTYEKEIIKSFNEKFSANIRLKKKVWWRKVLRA